MDKIIIWKIEKYIGYINWIQTIHTVLKGISKQTRKFITNYKEDMKFKISLMQVTKHS